MILKDQSLNLDKPTKEDATGKASGKQRKEGDQRSSPAEIISLRASKMITRHCGRKEGEVEIVEPSREEEEEEV